jgi:uncharacterized protein DUF3309
MRTILLLLGALPLWPYSAGWGYYPGGALGLILIMNWLRVSHSGRCSCRVWSTLLQEVASTRGTRGQCNHGHTRNTRGHHAEARPTLRPGVPGRYRPAPLEAQARADVPTGLSPRLSSHLRGPLHGAAVAVPARAERPRRATGPSRHPRRPSLCHMGRCGVALAGMHRPCAAAGGPAAP